MIAHDVRRTNDAIDRLLAVTTNPRHRFLLQAFYRHRFLEIAGRYEEIFAPEMMCDSPVYHFDYAKMNARVVGNDVKGLYAHWGQSNQTIFYAGTEQVAVADNYVASVGDIYQQRIGAELATAGFQIDDPKAYYLYYARGVQLIWPYDDQCRLVGEDVDGVVGQRGEGLGLPVGPGDLPLRLVGAGGVGVDGGPVVAEPPRRIGRARKRARRAHAQHLGDLRPHRLLQVHAPQLPAAQRAAGGDQQHRRDPAGRKHRRRALHARAPFARPSSALQYAA